jgi:predicted Zn-dependent peptidase
MTTTNRSLAPSLKPVEHLEINNYKTYQLSNKIPVYYVEAPEEELVRVELRFHAGRWYETGRGISRAACNLIKKGTSTKNSKQLADAIEFYGAHLETQHGVDYTSVSIVTLDKYLKETLPVVEEILTDATFPDDELKLFVQKQKQKLRINAQNTDFHANRKFGSVLFGEEHPYGYAITEADLDQLTREQLLAYHKTRFTPGDATVFIAGKITNETFGLVEKHFGLYPEGVTELSASDKSIHTDAQHSFFIEKDDSVQSSIRIGNLTISKTHPDYAEFNVLNTIFGGYFGSRLMSNIREDKGYTYGIYSSISHYRHSSYFSIETEVGNEVCTDALKEIYHELDAMRNLKVDDEELTIVKNYMMGSLLRATDGPYNRINVIKNIVMSGLDTTYFDNLVHAIKTVTPERLQELAHKYFVKEHMKEVVCGKRVA